MVLSNQLISNTVYQYRTLCELFGTDHPRVPLGKGIRGRSAASILLEPLTLVTFLGISIIPIVLSELSVEYCIAIFLLFNTGLYLFTFFLFRCSHFVRILYILDQGIIVTDGYDSIIVINDFDNTYNCGRRWVVAATEFRMYEQIYAPSLSRDLGCYPSGSGAFQRLLEKMSHVEDNISLIPRVSRNRSFAIMSTAEMEMELEMDTGPGDE